MWQYKVVRVSDYSLIETELNKYAKSDWEFVSITPVAYVEMLGSQIEIDIKFGGYVANSISDKNRIFYLGFQARWMISPRRSAHSPSSIRLSIDMNAVR